LVEDDLPAIREALVASGYLNAGDEDGELA
jgi:hypothetical protein